jgi:CII-binding regulator of phage lambda lysogenization HflD
MATKTETKQTDNGVDLTPTEYSELREQINSLKTIERNLKEITDASNAATAKLREKSVELQRKIAALTEPYKAKIDQLNSQQKAARAALEGLMESVYARESVKTITLFGKQLQLRVKREVVVDGDAERDAIATIMRKFPDDLQALLTVNDNARGLVTKLANLDFKADDFDIDDANDSLKETFPGFVVEESTTLAVSDAK